MAKAKLHPIPAQYEVVLTLTLEEAKTLRALTGGVGGSKDNSPRKHTDAIWGALCSQGISDELCTAYSGSICFRSSTNG